MRLEGGERIVRDLWLCRRHCGDERALAGVRVPHECHIGHQFEFECQPSLGAMFALLGKLRCTALVRQKSGVAAATQTPGDCLPAQAMGAQVGENLSAVHVAHDGAFGNFHLKIFAAAAVQVFAHARYAVFASSVGMVAKRHE